MSLRQQIQNDQTAALKNRDAETLSVLRMLFSAIRNAEIDARQELSDQDVVLVIRRQVKQLEDALGDFQKGQRDDLVQKTKKETDILRSYLPAEMSDDELARLVQKTIDGMENPDPAQFGRVMGTVMKEVDNRANGERVKKAVTECLARPK